MSIKKIMISGANGQLGSDLAEVLTEAGHIVFPLTHQDFDLADVTSYRNLLDEKHPDVFINTAAFHHVDQCEADPEKAMLINCTGPATLAKYCEEKGIRFIHFSTDYVFNGNKNEPYVETDMPDPLNNYGFSKFRGEDAILKENNNALILRVSAIYGKHPCRAKNGLNFVQLMLKKAGENADLKVVDDELISPTSTESIAKIVLELLDVNVNGILHLTSEGFCSWHEFAKEIFDYTATNAKLFTAKSSDFPAKTPRPKYSVMENERLKKLNISQMPHWKNALHLYLDKTQKQH